MHENSFSVIISREIQRRGKLLGRQRKLKKLLPGNIFRSQKVQLHVTSSPPLHLLAMWTRNVCVAPAPVTASPMVGPVESRDREVSSTFLPRPQRSPSGQSRSVGSECRRLEESRVFTAAHLCSWDSLILGLFWDWDLWWSETRRCESGAGMWKDQSAATSEDIFSLILKQLGSYGKTQQVCWLSQLLA